MTETVREAKILSLKALKISVFQCFLFVNRATVQVSYSYHQLNPAE